MRKIVIVTFFIFLAFLIEFSLFNISGRWFIPNLTILFIIYFNLVFGIRFSIYAAVVAGFLKDSFGLNVFGLSMFSLVFCAYMTTILKRYLHYGSSKLLKFLLVFFILIINFMTHGCLYAMFGDVNIIQTFQIAFIPEVVSTLIVTPFVFNTLRKCVSRLFV